VARVAFIGLGAMGGPMARNLIAGGHDVAVFDVARAAVASFEDAACRRGASAADAATDADFVITMLPTAADVRAALLDAGGACEALAEGALVIDMSTVGAGDSMALAADLAGRGLRMIDAPVGRGPLQAEKGTLLVMAGGAAADVDAARLLFDCLAERVVHVGPQGHGAKLKLVNNYMSMVGVAMTAETLALAAKAGLDRETVVEVLQGTAAGRGAINDRFPRKVLSGDVAPEFPVRLGAKDLGLALGLGGEASSPLALGAAARQIFDRALDEGRDDEDCTALLLVLEAMDRDGT
jgi:4-hydroxybutyrate dehydrogenase/sulfolactaldehyde 3-reductase